MGIFGNLFDFNGDGKTDIFEEMMELDFIEKEERRRKREECGRDDCECNGDCDDCDCDGDCDNCYECECYRSGAVLGYYEECECDECDECDDCDCDEEDDDDYDEDDDYDDDDDYDEDDDYDDDDCDDDDF